MHEHGLVDPGRGGDVQEDLVPGRGLVAGDVEGLADGGLLAEEPGEPDREVAGVGDGPQRGAVAVDDDGLAGAHPLDDGPAAVEGQQGLVVGVGGPHDGGGEAVLAVGGGEDVLALDLVAGVLPERVAQRRGLGDGQVRGRGLVGRGRGDEEVLPGAAGEELDVAADLLGGEHDPVDDGVEGAVAEDGAHGRGVAGVGGEDFGAVGDGSLAGAAAVEDGDVEALGDGLADAGGGDPAGPADEQHADAHVKPLSC
ncbi:hypothetical protein GCM10009830_28330 [Glycomyces endophyticus]|uniref:Uncharacterized protein n=1 Tax=Glycomyces endophyticus TaxID=480996 RepID=A0ABP4SZ45_9ACTN